MGAFDAEQRSFGDSPGEANRRHVVGVMAAAEQRSEELAAKGSGGEMECLPPMRRLTTLWSWLLVSVEEELVSVPSCSLAGDGDVQMASGDRFGPIAGAMSVYGGG